VRARGKVTVNDDDDSWCIGLGVSGYIFLLGYERIVF